MGKKGKRYSPKFQFQVVLEVLKGDRDAVEIARAYDLHPTTVARWKRQFLENGAAVFGKDAAVAAYEKKIKEMEQLLGRKEVEIALLEILRENSAYGYRRIGPELKDRGYPVGETVVLRRVLGMWGLLLHRWAGKSKPSVPRKGLAENGKGTNLVAGISDPEPLGVFYTDFTELAYAKGDKKAYLMALVDHATKWVVGWAVGRRPRTRSWRWRPCRWQRRHWERRV